MSSWVKVSPGVFRCELGGVEKVYRKISTNFLPLEKEHWVIHCVCTLGSVGEEIVGALRGAWKILRLEYPGLGIVPDGLTYKSYSVSMDTQAIEDWVDQTFSVQLCGTASDVIAAARPNTFPNLYYFPASTEVLFLSAHWRIDGIGTIMILNRLLTLVSRGGTQANSVNCRADLSRHSPSLEDAVGAATEYTDNMKSYARDYITQFHKQAVQKASFPFKGDYNTPPAESRREALHFTRESTSAIVAACKNRQISVTAAIHAALAEVYFAYSEVGDGQSDYTTATSVNMRKYLPLPYNTAMHPCQPYVTSITPCVRRSSNFAERAATLTKQYGSWYNEDFRNCLRLIYQYHIEALSEVPSVPGAKPPPPASGLYLSSLGSVEKVLATDYGDSVKVEDFRFGVSMLTRQILLYAWTFNGQLTLSLNYNDAYYDHTNAKEILDRKSVV